MILKNIKIKKTPATCACHAWACYGAGPDPYIHGDLFLPDGPPLGLALGRRTRRPRLELGLTFDPNKQTTKSMTENMVHCQVVPAAHYKTAPLLEVLGLAQIIIPNKSQRPTHTCMRWWEGRSITLVL